MPVKSPVRPTTNIDPQAMNSSCVKSSPNRYGRRKMASTDEPVKIDMSPSHSMGARSGLSHGGGVLGGAETCSAIASLLLRDRPARTKNSGPLPALVGFGHGLAGAV